MSDNYTLEELIELFNKEVESFNKEKESALKGVKSAQARMRKATNALSKIGKNIRSVTLGKEVAKKN
jgi:hypothetical protein